MTAFDFSGTGDPKHPHTHTHIHIHIPQHTHTYTHKHTPTHTHMRARLFTPVSRPPQPRTCATLPHPVMSMAMYMEASAKMRWKKLREGGVWGCVVCGGGVWWGVGVG